MTPCFSGLAPCSASTEPAQKINFVLDAGPSRDPETKNSLGSFFQLFLTRKFIPFKLKMEVKI